MARQGRGHHFHAAMRKYGQENFTFSVLGDFDGDEDLAKLHEVEAIAKYRPEYNISYGGDGHHVALESRKKIGDANRGKKWTESQRAKLLVARIGRRLAAEHRRKISEANKGRVLAETARQRKRGRVVSAETRAKIAASNTGKSPSAVTRAKLREFNLGKKTSEETKRKISAANKGKPAHNRGVPHTAETKEKMRLAQLGKVRTDEARANMRAAQVKNKRPIKCLTDGRVFPSAREAEDFYGLCQAAVTRVARGITKSTRGLRFAYYEDKK